MISAAANNKISSFAKHLDYVTWHAVPLRLFGPLLGPILQPNQRAYFDSNDFPKDKNGKEKRIVAIDITAGTNGDAPSGPMQYQSMLVLNSIFLPLFNLTLVNTKAEEAVKDYPVSDLNNNQNFGKIRVFDLFPKIDECYVVLNDYKIYLTFPNAFVNTCILFNFATVPW